MSLIVIKDLSFYYHTHTNFNFNIDSFSLNRQEHIFLEGPSGSGKTTFLNLITGLAQPQKGSVSILGTNIFDLSATKRDRFRADHFGIIFQLFNLVDYLSVIDNIVMPCFFSAIRRKKALQNSNNLPDEARRLCRELNIETELLGKKVKELSIGQQQRVAIARALIGSPEIIIADEPTSALDFSLRDQFIKLLKEECEKNNLSLLFVSHDLNLKSMFTTQHHINEIAAL